MNQEVCARCSVQETSSGNCTGCDPAAFRTFGIEETLPGMYVCVHIYGLIIDTHTCKYIHVHACMCASFLIP